MSRDATLPSALPTGRKVRIALAYYAMFVLLGLMLTCIGPSLDALQSQSGSTTAAIAVLFTANALGYIAGSLLAGRLYGAMPGDRVLPVALLVLAALTATVPALGSLWLLIVVFALIGVPLGVMDVGGNTLLVWLFRDSVPPFMNALHLSFGIGALVGPLLFDRFAVGTGNAATTFWLFAALMVPVALWLARMPSPDSPAVGRTAPEGGTILRTYGWLIALIAAFFFMHMGGELAFGGWIYTYANGVTESATTSRLINSVFWAGIVGGRLVAVPLAMRLSPRAMLQVDLVGAVASLAIVVALADSVPALWLGTVGFGFFIASMIPSSFNLAERRMPITGQVSAAFLVGGSLGSMSLPWVVGQLFASSPLWAIYVTGGAMLVAWVLFVVIVRARVQPVAGSASTAEGIAGA